MAPKVSAAAPAAAAPASAFYEEDILAIKEHFEANGDVLIHGVETDIPDDDDPTKIRRYQYDTDKWVFVGLFDDKSETETDPSPAPATETEAASPPAAPTSTTSKKARTANASASTASKKARTATGSKKASATSAVSVEPSATATAAADTTAAPDLSVKQPAKQRKPRANANDLGSVLLAIQENRIGDAQSLLTKYIDRYGAKPKRQRRSKSDELVEGEPPAKKVSEYNLFVGAALAKLKTSHPDETPKERMRLAMTEWRAHKETTLSKAV